MSREHNYPSYSPLKSTDTQQQRMQTVQSNVVCVEQNLNMLCVAVNSCRGALHRLHEELAASDNCMQHYAEKCGQYHHVNLSLFKERDDLAKKVDRLYEELASVQRDNRQLNDINDALQKRMFKLDLAQEDHDVERRNLRAKLAFLEADRPEQRWPSPIRVRLPSYQEESSLMPSPESSLDLDAEGKELVEIMLEGNKKHA